MNKNAKVTVSSPTILSLVEDFHSQSTYIPPIQREYVWNGKKVANFLDSLYRGLPIGGFPIVITEISSEVKKEGVLTLDGERIYPKHFLIDGQQRITTLERIYYLDVTKLDDPANDPACVLFNLLTEEFSPYSKKKHNSPEWVFVSQMLRRELPYLYTPNAEEYKKIVAKGDRIGVPLLSHDEFVKRLMKLEGLVHIGWQVAILEDFDDEDVDEIFTRINSGGASLTSKDLLKPTLVRKCPNYDSYIVSRIKEALPDFSEKVVLKEIKDVITDALVWDLLGKQILGHTSLMVENKSPQEVEKSLKVATEGLVLTLNLLSETLGIDSYKMLKPVSTLVPLMVYFGNKKIIDEKYELRASETVDSAIYFYLLLNIGNLFSRTNSIKYKTEAVVAAKKDAKYDTNQSPLLNLLNFIESYVDDEISIEYIQESKKNSFATHLAGFIAYANKATAWGEIQGIHFKNSDEHHIHPQSLLKAAGYSTDEINNTANIVYATSDFNKHKMKDYEPIVYREMLALPDKNSEFEKLLVVSDRELWKTQNYRKFLQANQELRLAAMNDFVQKYKPQYRK